MLNFSFIALLFLFSIYQRLFLINEEALILVCFTIFCFSVFYRVQESIYLSFQERSKEIKDSVTESLNQLILITDSSAGLQKKSQVVISELKTLKQHFIEMNAVLAKQLCKHAIQQNKSVYQKKLTFIYRLEQQSSKLLILLLSRKISRIVILKNFYTSKLKIPTFLCFDKIILRECLEMV